MLDMVTPKKGVYYLRQMANNTAIDVLMYLNMGVADEIHNTVCHQLNTIRDEFATEHPNKHIRVSIFGHSLGSVITYDVLHKNEKSETPILNFIPENAFLIGTPSSALC
jgi:surfactin synthase thioesterase subunit